MPPAGLLRDWAPPRRAAIDALLQARFHDAWPEQLGVACRYPLETGGKRIRALLTLAVAECLAPDADPRGPRHAAAAVEAIHAYSLVHDDLPALDDDEERRGRPTVHVAFGEAPAILVGDALLTEAFALLADAPLPAEWIVALVGELARAAGHRGMVGGQGADIGMAGPVTDVETLLRLHRGKTGALIAAAARLGAIAVGADDETLARIGTYGEALGLAFQMADDILDEDEDAGDDGPPSYVRLLGRQETSRRAQALADEAIAAVTALPQAVLPRSEVLVTLARFAVARDH